MRRRVSRRTSRRTSERRSNSVGLRSTTTTATPLPVSPRGAKNPAPAPATAKPAAPARPASPSKRSPDFTVPGAPKEPVKEIPLPQRARLLAGWIAAHPKPTDANVRHFLFQHTWIVTGARFGWWHGAEALRQLIVADRIAQKRWGIGKRSELVARSALAEVEARVK